MKKLSIPGLVFFIYYTTGCSSANSIGYVSSPIAFYFSQKPAVDGTGKNYVDLNDGQRIYGDKVDVGGNGFKIKIIVNHVKYNLDEVYYTVFGRELFRTIVKGEKAGVHARTAADGVKKLYYSKNGKLTPLQSLKDVSKAIGDCSATQSVNSLTNDDLKKETKENIRFLNDLFEKYNKDCK